ncbi:MAG TPA: glycosyltransferase family 39 protein [Smithella sp.]|nr:glycosyltransferase family 39 protein [Smithella sp.]HQI73312.1 glycosyltransferase family 39 protein [Smithella sp.]
MTVRPFSENLRKPSALVMLTLTAVILLLGVWRIMFYIHSPDVLLLMDRAGARWIRYDGGFVLEAKSSSRTANAFKYVFHTAGPVDNAVITLQALKKADVFFDGKKIYATDNPFEAWKQIHQIKLPFVVDAGAHEIIISVMSESSYPAVIAYSGTLPVRTGEGWLASADGQNWHPAVPASRIEQPASAQAFPSSFTALGAIWPYLAVIFFVTLAVSLWTSRDQNNVWKSFGAKLGPSQIRWLMLLSWAVLSVNNLFHLNYQVGTDAWGHIEYIDYIVTKGRLPLALEGWHMFQAPLNYVISAPLYALLIKWFDFPVVVKVMGIIPVICGLLQIEVVYRAARLVFQEKKHLQILTIIAGSLLPIHTYACQYVGNEPLAACLISYVILLCLNLIVPDQKERGDRYFLLLGLVWGLALLSKMTSLLLAPVLLLVIMFHTRFAGKSLKYSLRPLGIVFVFAALTAGWYYLRNYLKLGNPFAGVFELMQILQWWQDPSYRTLSHFLSFGQSLIYPVYAGVTSFWDMFYTTLWLDGLNSGMLDFIPWNENWMIAGALLALPVTVFMLTGMGVAVLNRKAEHRREVLFSAGMVVFFLAAMIDMYMVCPLYSRTKASYTLGLLPCWAMLIAAGAEPFLRHRIIRAVTVSLIACWAFAAYAAYFVTGLH